VALTIERVMIIELVNILCLSRYRSVCKQLNRMLRYFKCW